MLTAIEKKRNNINDLPPQKNAGNIKAFSGIIKTENLSSPMDLLKNVFRGEEKLSRKNICD